MELQLHVRIADNIVDFTKIEKNYVETDPCTDRVGGFWTSTYSEGIGSDWVQKKVYKPYIHIYKGYLYRVSDAANIYTIKSMLEEKHFFDFYKGDYNNLANDYDALRLDKAYLKYCRDYHVDSHFFAWGVECTWWFNPLFLTLEKIIDGVDLLAT